MAVLPFENLTGDDKKAYMADGLAAEIISTQSIVPELKVPARTASYAYKGRQVDARQIAKDLNVAVVLEGPLQSAGDRVRITAELVSASSGLTVLSKRYDRPMTARSTATISAATDVMHIGEAASSNRLARH